ncbi:[NiFe]-hydrogenase assembly chaperone HybE [Rhodopseudomonas telluris]|uniref:[NiFe]-hydrogenase assembly chaperone HybE n=2 Tax=Rhodopseudomonas telluris TaxID=644215 RepID=A0ABV6EM74_9BRAD
MHTDAGRDRDDEARALGEAVAAIYRRADAAMRDLPIYNSALSVAALGFREVDGVVLGIVVTPWFMNLVRVPPPGEAALPPGTGVPRALPVGVLDFTVAMLDGVGTIESCSLVSPMYDFVDQQQAEATALAALAVVLAPPENTVSSAAGQQTADSTGSTSPDTAAPPSLDRRRFLRGALAERRP